ncbi:uncharacterized protein [Argopecten irradians]|uniref:uncharacterized protein n=1 Tax=Argopecten irradians TaxID=31199 RepID=UPI0037165BE5
MENWTSRPQDKWPRLTGLANRDRSSVEEAQMSTYESPYTAENPASFYHYSLHPDDLATRRSISVYSLKNPDGKKKGGRFPQCRVCFATMLLVSLGVAIAVAVTLAIMLSNPHPRFYRTKISTGNATLTKESLKIKEADFGNDICDLMNAIFDLRDSSHPSRKVTDCSVILTDKSDSPGNLVLNVKLNVDETFIQSDAEKIKSMLVANAFKLSSNSSLKKMTIAVPANRLVLQTATSDVTTTSPTVVATSSASSIFANDVSSSITPSSSSALLLQSSSELSVGDMRVDTTGSVSQDVSSRTPSSSSMNQISSSILFVDTTFSHQKTDLMSSADIHSSSISVDNIQTTIDPLISSSIFDNVVTSSSVFNSADVSDLTLLTTTTEAKLSEATMTSSEYENNILSSKLSSVYETNQGEATSYAQATSVDMSSNAPYTSMEEIRISPSSISSYSVKDSTNVEEGILTTLVEPGLETTKIETESLYSSHVSSPTELITSSIDLSSDSISSFSSSEESPPLPSIVSSNHFMSGILSSSLVSGVYQTESVIIHSSTDNTILSESSTATVLYPSSVIDTPVVLSVSPSSTLLNTTLEANNTLDDLPPMLKWLDTTMYEAKIVNNNNSSLIIENPWMNKTDNITMDVTVPELKNYTEIQTSPSSISVPELGNNTDGIGENKTEVTIPSVKPEVKAPVISSTQSPTTTTPDMGKVIFESDISNRAMGTANPKDFWDNILKMVQYTSTKKPKFSNMEEASTSENISSNLNASSISTESITSAYESVTQTTDTRLMSSVYAGTATTSVMKSSEGVAAGFTSSEPMSSDVYPSVIPSSVINVTPMLTAEPGLVTSAERVSNDIASTDILMTATPSKVTSNTENLELQRSTTSDIPEDSVSSVQDSTIKMSAPSAISSSSLISDVVSSSSATRDLDPVSEDYAFYDLMPASSESSSASESTGVFSSNISPSSTMSQPLATDEIAFYDLMPESLITSSSAIASSMNTQIQRDVSLTLSPSIEASNTPNIDATASLDIEANMTVEKSRELTSFKDSAPSFTMKERPMSSVYTAPGGMKQSTKVNVEATPSQSAISTLPPLTVEPQTVIIDASPSLTTETFSSLLSSESSGMYEDINTSGSLSTSMDATPSLGTLSREVLISSSSITDETTASTSSASIVSQTPSSEIKLTASISEVTSSITTPPSPKAVFNPGSEFDDRLFFANDFSKMDFTRSDFTTDENSDPPSSLLNTVPKIPRVTTPSLLDTRVRVPELFQPETDNFQNVPTTPKPAVTTPKVAPPVQNDQGGDNLSSGRFLFDLGSLGSSFGSNLGLGNINFN